MANPAHEVITALRPGLARTPGALLVAISSPYSRTGPMWQMFSKYYGRDDARILIWKSQTDLMNPQFDQAEIARAVEEDPAVAKSEYFAEFRTDIESYVDPESVARCVIPGRVELPPAQSLQYSAFVDVAGGSGQDSFTWGIAHLHGFVRPANYEDLPTRFKVAIQDEENKIRCEAKARGTVVVDLVREVKPPFSPEQAVEQCCADLARYRIREIVGDKYAGSWPAEVFKKRGIRYCESPETKSQIYQNFLPLLNSGKLELPDDRRLVSQLCNLERRTSRAGRDSIDHAPGAHDDLCNAACGAALLVISSTRSGGSVQPITWVR